MQLFTHSGDRQANESAQSYTVQLPRSVTCCEITLKHAGVFNCSNNVTQYNGTIKIVVSATTYTITLAYGQYLTLSLLCTEIQTKLNAAGTGLTFTAVGTTNKINISATGAFTIRPDLMTASARYLFGFESTQSGTSITAENYPNLISGPAIMLKISLSQAYISPGYALLGCFTIPIDQNKLEIVQFDEASQWKQKIKIQQQTVTSFIIELFDAFGNPYYPLSDWCAQFSLN